MTKKPEPLSVYAFNYYGSDARLYNGIHQLEERIAELEGEVLACEHTAADALKVLVAERKQHENDLHEATAALRTIRARVERMLKRNPAWARWWAKVDEAAEVPDVLDAGEIDDLLDHRDVEIGPCAQKQCPIVCRLGRFIRCADCGQIYCSPGCFRMACGAVA